MALRNSAIRLMFVALAVPPIAYAQIQCPSPPQQVSKDASVAVQVAVGRLGPVKAGEFSTNVQNTTRDLLGSLAKGDRVYLEQMMFAAFCSSLQSDGSLTGREKTRALRDCAREVRQTMSPASSPAPSPEPRREPSAPSPQPVKTGASDAAVTKQADKKQIETEPANTKQTSDTLAKFAVGRKIFVNYNFSTACAFWVS